MEYRGYRIFYISSGLLIAMPEYKRMGFDGTVSQAKAFIDSLHDTDGRY